MILIIVACVFTFGAAAGPIGGGIIASISAAGANFAGAVAGAAGGAWVGSVVAGGGMASIMGTAYATSAVGVAVGAAVAGAAAATAAGVYAVAKTIADDQRAANEDKAYAEELRQKAAFENSDSHGEYVSIDWNYMEKITTDFNRDTMTCKRCVIARKCNKTKWHLFTDRNCGSWGKWEEPKCNELKF